MSLLVTTAEVNAACARFGRHPFVTVDTEFLRETTFWPKVCVIQIASDDEAVAIDALADDMDLTAFFDLMANERVTKVFHAARQDIEIVWHLARLIPKPLFDTQVAATVCGFGDQVAYGELVQALCKIPVDKSSRFTDWSRRPLSQAQIDYALADVTHLRDVYRKLVFKLEKSGRMGWLCDDMQTLLSPATYEQHPDNAWERLRGRARKPRDLAVLMEVAAWREREAQSRDVPRSRVLKDDAMIDIVAAAPKDAEALSHLRSTPRGMERSRGGQDLVEAIQRGLARDPKSLPRIQREHRNASGGATVELLKVLLRQVAEKSGVASRMIATVDDLEAIASDDRAKTPALAGWRRDLFGAKALELKHGRLALTVENGKVVTLEWRDDPETGAQDAAQ